MSLVNLRSGSRVARDLAEATLTALRDLAHKDLLAFYEFVRVCRDPQHRLPTDDGTADILVHYKLVDLEGDQHVVNEDLRSIVLSAVEGDGMRMRIVEPWAAAVK